MALMSEKCFFCYGIEICVNEKKKYRSMVCGQFGSQTKGLLLKHSHQDIEGDQAQF